MKLWELIVTAVGLSMDAFAIAICKGLSVGRLEKKHMALTGLWFGGAQALMPLIGYLLGGGFRAWIERFDHWIAFFLLLIIGLGMIRESRQEGKALGASFAAGAMFPLAVANSIDALATGVTFAFLQVEIIPAVCLIGCTTFVLSCIGVKVGHVFGAKYKSRARCV